MPDHEPKREPSLAEPLSLSGAGQTEEGETVDEPQEYRLGVAVRPERLDKILAGLLPQHSRSRLQGWIEGGHVLLNGQAARVRQLAGPGDIITVHPQTAPEDLAFSAEPVDFEVVAESAEWLVVNKPAGLVTHPGAGNWSGTLLNGLLHRYPELARVPRAGIVHRLDKDTSGIMVVARTGPAQTDLVRQLQARSVRREYIALAHGRVQQEGSVTLAIGRDPAVPVRMAVERPIAPKPALTHYQPLATGNDAEGQLVTQLRCRLETGRTHQIRVHMASLRHPLVGDVLYGGRLIAGAKRQMLHAATLGFADPGGSGNLCFHADPPADFLEVQQAIQWQ